MRRDAKAQRSRAGGGTSRLVADIAGEARILSGNLVVLGDGAPEMGLSEVTSIPNQVRVPALVRALTERLYVLRYCRRDSAGDSRPPGDDDMLGELRRANTTLDGWDQGWRFAGRDDHGNVLVRRGQSARLTELGLVRIADGGPLGPDTATGAAVRLQIRREDLKAQSGYYYAYGQTLGDRYEELVSCRFYLNLGPAAAPFWMERVTHELNRSAVPFTFKMPRRRSAYGRLDAAVLYVPRRHAGFVAGALVALARAQEGHLRLRAGVPAFTRRLGRGLSIADSPPDGESFGITRMALVAEGIVDEWCRGRTDVNSRVDSIRQRFKQAELDWNAPWLNPGNVDVALAQMIQPPSMVRPADEWLSAADRIGAAIIRDAQWHGDECTWLGWYVQSSGEAHRPVVCTAGTDLYSGTAGIALFLAALAKSTDDPRHAETARAAFRHTYRRVEEGRGGVGAYAGLGGTLHAAFAVAECLGDSEAADAIPKLLSRLLGNARHRFGDDVVSGRAGVIRLLLRLASNAGLGSYQDMARRAALAHGEELLQSLRAHHLVGVETVQPPGNLQPIGFAHGAVGIASALLALHEEARSSDYLDAALKMLEYEWQAFDPTAQDWPDRRSIATNQAHDGGMAKGAHASFMTAWCSGAPGVALALSRHVLKLSDPRIKAHFDAALETTANSLRNAGGTAGGMRSFCLCHGTAGNADILLQIGMEHQRGDLLARVDEAARAGLERHSAASDWPCGIHDGGPSHGLMLGTAGIGYFYLRLHAPQLFSSLY